MATAAEPIAPEVPSLTRAERADHAMRQAMLWSFGAGFVPSPAFDVAAIAGIQLNMLHDLSRIYDVPFREDVGKKLLGALVGGVGARWFADTFLASALKLIPVAGTLLAYAAMPASAAASSYAVAKVFIQHFESGGTFLDFDPDKVKAYFAQQYAEGKRVVSETIGTRKPAPAK